MIEFAAVIQQILVTPDATTMQLDISVLDVTPLTELLDKEISVSVRPPAEKQKPK